MGMSVTLPPGGKRSLRCQSLPVPALDLDGVATLLHTLPIDGRDWHTSQPALAHFGCGQMGSTLMGPLQK